MSVAIKTSLMAVLLFVTASGFSVRILTSSMWLAFESGRLDTADKAGMRDAELQRTNEDVLRLLSGEISKLKSAKLFSKREVSHLKDVKEVLSGLTIARDTALSLLALIGFMAMFGRRKWWTGYLRRLKHAGLVNLVVIAVLGIMSVWDFDLVFQQFHELLFPAGTWTFNPGATLIQLYPEQFWVDSLTGCMSGNTLFMMALVIICRLLLIHDKR